MSERVVVVGKGPAGLLTASYLVRSGLAVTVVADGQGTLPLWSGHFDFRSVSDTGQPVEDPWAAWATVSGHPHPSGGRARWRQLWEELHDIWQRAGIPLPSRLPLANVWTITATGLPRATFLAPSWQYQAASPESVILVGFDGLSDSMPEWQADRYQRMTGLRAIGARLPKPPKWTPLWSSVRWAAFLDGEEGYGWMLDALDALLSRVPSGWPLVLPQVLGLRSTPRRIQDLTQRYRRPVSEYPLTPPGIGGLRIAERWEGWLKSRNVTFLSGHVGEVGAGGVRLAGGRFIPGTRVILATGGILGGGLVVHPDGRVEDPVERVVVGVWNDSVTDDQAAAWGRSTWGQTGPVAGRQVGGCDPDRHGDGGAMNLWTAALAAERVKHAMAGTAGGH